MPQNPKKLNHPLTSYLMGLIVVLLALVVLAGVLHHLTVSHHGPQLLASVREQFLEKKKSTLLDAAMRLEDFEKHRHFHHVVDYPQIPENKQSVCFICHSEFPHKKNKRIRSLMNMHTQYFACETCHIKDRAGAAIGYRWHHPTEENPQGPFFGTHYEQETGRLVSGDPYSKIAPYYRFEPMLPPSLSFVKIDSVWSVLQDQSSPRARDYIRVRDKLTPEQREGAKNLFHEHIKPKGHECKACHSEKSIFDYKKLGFDDKRASDLTHLEVTGMIARYEEFYLPELFTDQGQPDRKKTNKNPKAK